jgi:hypothetical protein
MTSKLIVDSIEGRTGATVSLPQDTNAELDWYQLASHHTTNDTVIGTIGSGWARVSSSSPHFFSKIGTGMSVSSGVWTFPRTGVYQITFEMQFQTDETDTAVGIAMQTSTDSGSNFSDYRFGFVGENSTSDIYKMGSSTAMINVTNVSTFRFRVLSNSLVTDGKFVGDGTNPYTSVMFERKYPSQ